MIKSSIARDAKVARLDGLLSKLLYTWSIPYCDREGRIRADDSWIMGNPGEKILMWDDDIHEIILGWAKEDLVVYYENNEGKYVQFHNFKKIQSMINTKTGKPTAVYTRERESEFPNPISCKIIAGQVKDELTCKVHTNYIQDAHKVHAEVEVEVEVEIEDEPTTGNFISEIEKKGYSPKSYEPMNAKEVISLTLGWIKKEEGIMVPKGSLDWNIITPKDRGVAKNIGKIMTPLWLPRALAYVKQCSGFKYGPFAPLVLSLIQKYNETDRRALEEIAEEI